MSAQPHACSLCGQPYTHAYLATACERTHREDEVRELAALWDCE